MGGRSRFGRLPLVLDHRVVRSPDQPGPARRGPVRAPRGRSARGRSASSARAPAPWPGWRPRASTTRRGCASPGTARTPAPGSRSRSRRSRTTSGSWTTGSPAGSTVGRPAVAVAPHLPLGGEARSQPVVHGLPRPASGGGRLAPVAASARAGQRPGDGSGNGIRPGVEAVVGKGLAVSGTELRTQSEGDDPLVAKFRVVTVPTREVRTSGLPDIDGAPGGALGGFGVLAGEFNKLAPGLGFAVENPIREHCFVEHCFVPAVSAVAVREPSSHADLYTCRSTNSRRTRAPWTTSWSAPRGAGSWATRRRGGTPWERGCRPGARSGTLINQRSIRSPCHRPACRRERPRQRPSPACRR